MPDVRASQPATPRRTAAVPVPWPVHPGPVPGQPPRPARRASLACPQLGAVGLQCHGALGFLGRDCWRTPVSLSHVSASSAPPRPREASWRAGRMQRVHSIHPALPRVGGAGTNATSTTAAAATATSTSLGYLGAGPGPGPDPGSGGAAFCRATARPNMSSRPVCWACSVPGGKYVCGRTSGSGRRRRTVVSGSQSIKSSASLGAGAGGSDESPQELSNGSAGAAGGTTGAVGAGRCVVSLASGRGGAPWIGQSKACVDAI